MISSNARRLASRHASRLTQQHNLLNITDSGGWSRLAGSVAARHSGPSFRVPSPRRMFSTTDGDKPEEKEEAKSEDDSSEEKGDTEDEKEEVSS